MQQSVTLPNDLSKLAPAGVKTYVLDTNVLLHDPTAITAFAEHRVVIPMTVLEELDHIKDRRDKSVSREARIAIQMIDKVVGSAAPQAIQAGVDIPGSTLSGDLGRLAIFPDQLLDANDNVPFLDSTQDQANDNRIINVALKYQSEHPDEFVCLVTKDINMRIKAKRLGVRSMLRITDTTACLMILTFWQRAIESAGDFWDGILEVDTVREDNITLHRIPRVELPEAYPNQFLYDDNGFISFVDHVDADYVYVAVDSRDNLMNQRFWGLAPRNLEQAMAMRLLDNDDLDMTVLTGPAGSGKTLLALAYGLHAILEQKKYNKLIVARSTPPMAEEIGFLPGTEEEKMDAMACCFRRQPRDFARRR